MSVAPEDAAANSVAAGRYRSVFRDGLFDGQVIIVTGGGSGIGRCTAHELARLGASLALIGRKIDKLQAVAEELRADNPGTAVECHSCDIREEEPVRDTVAAILKRFGRIDGLVNNAGGQFPAPLAQISQGANAKKPALRSAPAWLKAYLEKFPKLHDEAHDYDALLHLWAWTFKNYDVDPASHQGGMDA